MGKTLRTAACLAPLIIAAVSARAQNVIQARMTGQPLQYMREGALTGCGLRIVAVDVAGDLTSDASEVSLNIDENGNALVKAVAYAKFLSGKSSPQPVKVAAAWAKAPGSNATRPLVTPVSGDDHLSMLYPTELTGALEIMKAQLDGVPVQISVQRPLQRSYRIMSGVVSMTQPEQDQLRNCLTELVQGMQRKLSDLPASAPR